MHTLDWLEKRDPGLASLRRAGRAAIVMPAMLAIGINLLSNPVIGTFAAFGSFAMLLLVAFPGSIRERVQAQVALSLVGGVLVCAGTLASGSAWLSTLAMALIAFLVLFFGILSSTLAAASTSLLLGFILPVTIPAAPSAIPDRLAGWGLAAGASLIAVVVLWPAPTRDRLRESAIASCRSLVTRLRADVAQLLDVHSAGGVGARSAALTGSDDSLRQLRATFLASPYRPGGLGTGPRSLVRVVERLLWIESVLRQDTVDGSQMGSLRSIGCPARAASADVLEECARALGDGGAATEPLEAALGRLRGALTEMEQVATEELSLGAFVGRSGTAMLVEDSRRFITALDPAFRAQSLGFAVTSVGESALRGIAAERRTWPQRVLGHEPSELVGAMRELRTRASTHLDRHSVWLHNSLRGAVALAAAVLVSQLIGLEHAFWAVLGALSVLRSNALNTGQSVLRGILGTAAGFIVGGALVELFGGGTTQYWVLLPIAVLLAGFAPAAISFAAGQAAFTVTLVILYNIVQPAGWRIGLVRIEDVALGCAVSLGVGLLFWPRGASAALGTALADAYTKSARYLAGAVAFGLSRCDGDPTAHVAPDAGSGLATLAVRRLDDAFRGYLAERGPKATALAEVTSLVAAPTSLLQSGDAVLDLWEGSEDLHGDRSGARALISETAARVVAWYDAFGQGLARNGDLRAPLDHDDASGARLLQGVANDLLADDASATATAVRIIWTSDHLDSARRLQATLMAPAQMAVERRAF
jgi:uncharacterized membrane protein YccC